MSRTCYLVAEARVIRRGPRSLPGTRTVEIVGVHLYSEPPWSLTRNRGGDNLIMFVVYERSAESYQKAFDQIRHDYPLYEPELARLFPCPEQ